MSQRDFSIIETVPQCCRAQSSATGTIEQTDIDRVYVHPTLQEMGLKIISHYPQHMCKNDRC